MAWQGGRMGEGRSARLDLAAPRAVFAELLAGAVDQSPLPPTPVATAYLIDLLEERVREPGCSCSALSAGALLAARGEPDATRLLGLRRVGDGALFEAGFFGESLSRAPFGAAPTCQAGRLAYGALSEALAGLAAEPGWSLLYEELADRFGDFADLLAEVGERARGGREPRRESLYARYLATGSHRDRRRLVSLGALAPEGRGLIRAQ